ncbi:MAG: 3-dehydroquinate synthase [Peptococcaceae bacterium]|nr:3-dehydroquinate synthase [Peptococcaceae bacterium]
MIARTIEVGTGQPYKVEIGHGLLDEIGAHLSQLHRPCQVMVVSDTNVAPLYLPRLTASLSEAGFRVLESVVPVGETSKSFSVLETLMNNWSLAGMHRSDMVIALGGGVVGDLAGFAASCYQRGIPFVQVPTTLLAAVDSSVGGKTAIDIAAGKNLVGAFYQPLGVFCDVDVIGTMTDAAFADGVAESIKYGVLHNPALFDRIAGERLQKDAPDLDAIIGDCVAFKNKIVTNDEFEKGTRQLLNLGHTFAHAIEHLSDFATSHGHAVAIGLAMMARASMRKGLCSERTARRIELALEENALPQNTDYDANAILEICRRDKKAGASAITIVVPQAIGDCVLRTVTYDELRTLITLGKEPL